MMDELFAVLGITALVLVVVIGGAYTLAEISCREQWRDSGFKTEYGFFSGCRIYKNGVLIPDKAYREIAQ